MADRVAEALAHLRDLTEFAYEQGFHELGYDPLKVVSEAISASTQKSLVVGSTVVSKPGASFKVTQLELSTQGVQALTSSEHIDEGELERMKSRGASAWKDVQSASVWVDELRGEGQPATSPAAPADAGHAQLMRFYSVDTLDALIAAQERHVQKLQAKLPPTPSLAPQRVREG